MSRLRSSYLAWVLGIGLALELGAALVLPALISDERYLDWYLSDEQEAAESRFLEGSHVLLPDSATGWRSAPNWSRGAWVTDSLGSRSTGRFAWSEGDRPRVIALGSSMMNGATDVTNAETITAFLEDRGATALNFATMLYGVDQALIQFRHRLAELRPDWVVIGVDDGAREMLANTYVPFRLPSEANMPFVKPRFELSSDTLVFVPAPPRQLLGADRRSALIAHTARHDGFASRFERFQRMEQTPGLAALAWLQEKVLRHLLGAVPGDPTPGLLLALLRDLEAEVESAGGRLVVVLLPPAGGGSAIPGWGGDPFERRRDEVEGAGFRVVDGRAVVEAVGSAGRDPYGPDGLHFSPASNEALASAIWTLIETERGSGASP